MDSILRKGSVYTTAIHTMSSAYRDLRRQHVLPLFGVIRGKTPTFSTSVTGSASSRCGQGSRAASRPKSSTCTTTQARTISMYKDSGGDRRFRPLSTHIHSCHHHSLVRLFSPSPGFGSRCREILNRLSQVTAKRAGWQAAGRGKEAWLVGGTGGTRPCRQGRGRRPSLRRPGVAEEGQACPVPRRKRSLGRRLAAKGSPGNGNELTPRWSCCARKTCTTRTRRPRPFHDVDFVTSLQGSSSAAVRACRLQVQPARRSTERRRRMTSSRGTRASRGREGTAKRSRAKEEAPSKVRIPLLPVKNLEGLWRRPSRWWRSPPPRRRWPPRRAGVEEGPGGSREVSKQPDVTEAKAKGTGLAKQMGAQAAPTPDSTRI